MKKVVIPVTGFQQAFTATAMAASLGLNRVVHSHKAYRTRKSPHHLIKMMLVMMVVKPMVMIVVMMLVMMPVMALVMTVIMITLT